MSLGAEWQRLSRLLRVFSARRGAFIVARVLSGASEEWVGIALDEPEGKNAGTIKGVSYFACDDKHGIMVRRTECKVV